MSTHRTDDFVDRIRAAAGAVPPHALDAAAVLHAAKAARRRRRTRQLAGATGAAGLLVIALAGASVPVPGLGTMTVPGSTPFRPAPPSAGAMARETAALQRDVLPVLRELRVTWFEKSSCDVLAYARGTFSRDGQCAGRPDERAFDAAATADLDRVLTAIERADVPTEELADATYAPDGRIVSLRFRRPGGGIRWDYAYIYSPAQPPPTQQTALGLSVLTPISSTGWYFEKVPND